MRPWAKLRRVLADLASFETVFVLFLFAGRIKGDERFAWMSVDLTALTFALSVGMGAVLLLRRRLLVPTLSVKSTATGVLFAAWMALTLLWSPSRIYGPQKVLYVAALGLWALIAPALLIGPSRRRAERLLCIVFVFGLWTAAEGTGELIKSGVGRVLNVFGNDYITFASTLSMAVSVLFVWLLLLPGHRLFTRLAGMIILTWLCGLLLVGGGRGPVVALSVAIFVVWVLVLGARSGRERGRLPARWRLLLWTTVVVAAITMLAPQSMTSLTTINRFLVWREGLDGGESVASRVALVRAALTEWSEMPVVGIGAGAFAVSQGNDARLYPHNLLVEVLTESGIVGVALLLAMLGVAVLPAIRRATVDDRVTLSAVGLFVVTFVASQFSGDLPDNRPLFMALGFLVGVMSQERVNVLVPVRPVESTRLYTSSDMQSSGSSESRTRL